MSRHEAAFKVVASLTVQRRLLLYILDLLSNLGRRNIEPYSDDCNYALIRNTSDSAKE